MKALAIILILIIGLVAYLGDGNFWRPLVHYNKGDIVGFQIGDWQEMFTSLRDDNMGHNPAFSPDWWE